MRATLAAFLLGMVAVLSAADTTADPRPAAADPERVPAAEELLALVRDAGTVRMDELRVQDLQHAAALLSVARQQQRHIRHSVKLSLLAPGLGHYVNRHTGRAVAFASADLLVQLSAGVAGYLLLPAAVKVANLNYLQTPFADIEARWEALTPAQLLPTVAVAVTGSMLSAVVRRLAARDAGAVALARIRTGDITFDPEPFRVPAAMGHSR